MPTLYSVRRLDNNAYRITKFDGHFNVLKHYGVFEYKRLVKYLCTCPAGENLDECKHKHMLRKFIAEHKVDTGWFYDFDAQSWERPANDPLRIMLQRRQRRERK